MIREDRCGLSKRIELGSTVRNEGLALCSSLLGEGGALAVRGAIAGDEICGSWCPRCPYVVPYYEIQHWKIYFFVISNKGLSRGLRRGEAHNLHSN